MAINLPDQGDVSLGGSNIQARDTFVMPQVDQSAARNAEALARSLQGFSNTVSNVGRELTDEKNKAYQLQMDAHATSVADALARGESIDVAMGKIPPHTSYLNRVATMQAAGVLLGNRLADDALRLMPAGLVDDPKGLFGWYEGEKARIGSQYDSNIALKAGVLQTLNGRFNQHRSGMTATSAAESHKTQEGAFQGELESFDPVAPPTPDQTRTGTSPQATISPINTTGSSVPTESGVIVSEASKVGLTPQTYTALLLKTTGGDIKLKTDLKFGTPVEGARTTGVFGEDRGDHKHNGVDYAVPVGTSVKAPAEGRVIRVWSDDKNGNAVKVLHPDGTITGYAHLSSVSVKEGDVLQPGQELALSGNTGRSTGPHLHYTVTKNGKRVDPLSFKGGDTAGQSLEEATTAFTKTLQEIGVKPGMSFEQAFELFTGGAEEDDHPPVKLASADAYQALSIGVQALTGEDKPEIITASGNPVNPSKAPDPGVHAATNPDDIINDPEVAALRAHFMDVDAKAKAGAYPQLSNRDRMNSMVASAIRIAIRRRDPKFLAAVPDKWMTDANRDAIQKAQEYVVNLRYTETERQRTENVRSAKIRIIEKLKNGETLDPFEDIKGPDGEPLPEMWEWAKTQLDNPVSEKESAAFAAGLRYDLQTAGSLGKWQDLRKKYPVFAQLLPAGRTPTVDEVQDAILAMSGKMNASDFDAVIKAVAGDYETSAVLAMPDFEQGWSKGAAIIAKNIFQGAAGDLNSLKFPKLETEAREVYDYYVESEVRALGRRPTGAEVNQIIRDANREAKEYIQIRTKSEQEQTAPGYNKLPMHTPDEARAIKNDPNIKKPYSFVDTDGVKRTIK